MNLTELRRLQNKVATEITRRASTAKRDLFKQVQKLAAEAGVSLGDLLAGEAKPAREAAPKKRGKPAKAKSPAAGSKVPAKYRHPENPSLTWTGRGRKPKWVEECLAQGTPLDQLTISK
ncbi:MAG: H-NS histone family protein [Rhodocyclaceae bacterium]|nr:H-NS histone family protein [Rhodocyclaceae bacterium]